MEKLLNYSFVVSTYQRSGWYDIEQNCNGYTVTNVGDVDVTINDQIFYAGIPGISLGDSRSFGGNRAEIYKGPLKVAFANPTAGVAPSIEVVQKVYVNLTADDKNQK